MARADIVDEREEVEADELDTQALGDEFIEHTQPPEDEVPEKYRGKSVKEVAQMHQELEKLLGKQSSEVGELRRAFDTVLKAQLEKQAPKEEEDEVDFFTDPEKATARAIDRHPKIKEAEQVATQYRQQTAVSKLQQDHPDMKEILSDNRFQEWVAASKIRTQLFQQADQLYDTDAASELFSLWKDRQQVVNQTAQAEKAGRKAAVKSASTGNARGSGEVSKKVYRRTDIINLMANDPDRYEQLSDEIMRAYQEGRVK
jgi:hypothetical protein